MEHIRINDKIRLEQIKPSMAGVIFETINSNRDYLKKWLPFVDFTQKVEDTEVFINSVIDTGNLQDSVYCIMYNETFAGLVGFKDTDWINKKTEIGYWLAENMQGKGIVSLCVEKLVRFAFQKQKLNRVQIKVAEGNERSEKVPLRLNFLFEGIERAGELHGSEYLNLKVYSKLKND